MARYRKRPVEIFAHKFVSTGDDGGQSLYAITLWMAEHSTLVWHQSEAIDYTDTPEGVVDPEHLIIPTLEGEMRAEVGDMIIQGVQGEFYPCKPDIFEKTHEEIGDFEDALPSARQAAVAEIEQIFPGEDWR